MPNEPEQTVFYPVLIERATFDIDAQTHPDKLMAWQRVLARAKSSAHEVVCLCTTDGERLLLSVHEKDARYHLQGYPRQGHLHLRSCRFHREARGRKNALPERDSPLPVHRDLQDRLPLGFVIPNEGTQRGGAGPSGSRDTPRVIRKSLETVLADLWKRAGLDQWDDRWIGKRTLFTVLSRLRTAATELEINGELMSSNLIVGELGEGGKAADHNATVKRKAQERRRRILVLGRLARPKSEIQSLSPLRLRNFHGAPFLLMSAELTHLVESEGAAPLSAWRADHNTVFVLAMAEPADRGRWFVVDIGFLVCDSRYVPLP